LWEVTLPHSQISVQKVPKTVAQLIEDVKSVAILGHGVFSNIAEVLASLKENSAGLRVEGMQITVIISFEDYLCVKEILISCY
jgi:hypothetical protein